MSEQAASPTFADRMATDYARIVERTADRLRTMAEEIERRPVRKNLHDLQPDYSAHAADTLHNLSWGFANLNLERIVTSASDADRAARTKEV